MDISTMKPSEIATYLKQSGHDLDVQAGVAILRGFGDGSLLEWPAITRNLVEEDGYLFMKWRQLANAYETAMGPSPDDRETRDGFIYLSTSAHSALQLAIALATGREVEDLGRKLCGFSSGNARVIADAIAICLHLTPEWGVPRASRGSTTVSASGGSVAAGHIGGKLVVGNGQISIDDGS